MLLTLLLPAHPRILQGGRIGKWHVNESKPLVAHLGSVTDAVDMFLKTIPKTPEYFGREVKDWQADQVTVYFDRLKRGKEHVENIADLSAEEHAQVADRVRIARRVLHDETEVAGENVVQRRHAGVAGVDEGECVRRHLRGPR